MQQMFYKRQIRIEGKDDGSPVGYAVTITDSNTGETIEDIKCIDIHMEPKDVILANVTYWEHDEDGSLVTTSKGPYTAANGFYTRPVPVEHSEVVHNPALSIGALETCTPLEKVVYEAIQDACLGCITCDAGMVQRFESKKAAGIADRLVRAIKQLEV
jgi:hypothetical protein